MLFSHWEIVKYLNAQVPWPCPVGETPPSYRDVFLPAIERGEEWHWSLRLKEAPAKMTGKDQPLPGKWDNRGYWLGLPWQGQGVMTEAVAAVNDYWFGVLGFKVLRASKAVANAASRRSRRKQGCESLPRWSGITFAEGFWPRCERLRRMSGGNGSNEGVLSKLMLEVG
jgi:[ribosomal protein S5]-alanine N-acetyltransferase